MSRWNDFIAWHVTELRKYSRNSEVSPSIFKMEISGKSAPSTPPSSRIPRNSRRKACRKCVESKAACDLGKPKCKRCKKPIRDGQRAVEALGGKWCWECFVCAVSAEAKRYVLQGLELMYHIFHSRAARNRSRILRSSRGTANRFARTVSVS